MTAVRMRYRVAVALTLAGALGLGIGHQVGSALHQGPERGTLTAPTMVDHYVGSGIDAAAYGCDITAGPCAPPLLGLGHLCSADCGDD